MRITFALVALVAFASGSVEPQSGAQPVVIIVHGRGHADGDSAALRRVWKRDLDSSLAIVGMPRLADADVRLAWYADVLDPESGSACETTSAATGSLGLDDFMRDFLSSLALALPREVSREARSVIGDLLYVADKSRRCAAERRVAGVIESAVADGRPVIVVAYSLGSVVAYGALHARIAKSQPAPDIRLITLGSPLGNAEIRELLGQGADSLRAPAGVSSWENIYDPNDAFAAPLGPMVVGRAARDRVTASSAGDPHYIGRYLRDRATGLAVGRALCASGPEPARTCAGLKQD